MNSLLPGGKLILWSLSYFATRYSMMLPLSKIRMGLPSSNLSVMAGMRPLGLMSRNHGSFWVFFENSILVTWYGRLERVSTGDP